MRPRSLNRRSRSHSPAGSLAGPRSAHACGAGNRLQSRAAAHARRQRPQLSLGAEPALRRPRLARRLPLGLREARQRHASSRARQARASGRRKECCPAIPRSLFPITSPSSPAFIPSTTASSPTISSIPRAARAIPCTIRRPSPTAPGTAAFRLWSLAESQGMRTACLLWVGSEAKIAGFRPS